MRGWVVQKKDLTAPEGARLVRRALRGTMEIPHVLAGGYFRLCRGRRGSNLVYGAVQYKPNCRLFTHPTADYLPRALKARVFWFVPFAPLGAFCCLGTMPAFFVLAAPKEPTERTFDFSLYPIQKSKWES